jgi:hypothetical protein
VKSVSAERSVAGSGRDPSAIASMVRTPRLSSLSQTQPDGLEVEVLKISRPHLGDSFSAIQELSKGKTTTHPARHTGERIFFTSTVVDAFVLDADGLRWTVDNLRGDQAVGSAPTAGRTRTVP